MTYSLINILSTLFIVLESCLIGWLTGEIQNTIISLLTIAGLRFFSGGFHLSSTLKCNIFSTIVCTSIPHIPFFFKYSTIILTSISLMIIVFFAPNVDNRTKIDQKYYPILKWSSILIIISNFYFHSYILGLCFFIQSLTVIPFGKEAKS